MEVVLNDSSSVTPHIMFTDRTQRDQIRSGSDTSPLKQLKTPDTSCRVLCDVMKADGNYKVLVCVVARSLSLIFLTYFGKKVTHLKLQFLTECQPGATETQSGSITFTYLKKFFVSLMLLKKPLLYFPFIFLQLFTSSDILRKIMHTAVIKYYLKKF